MSWLRWALILFTVIVLVAWVFTRNMNFVFLALIWMLFYDLLRKVD